MLLEKIKKELEESQRNRDNLKLQTLRLLLSEIHNYEINQRGKELKDEDIIQIIQKEIKKRKEAREIFLKGNRSDLALQAEEEIKILSLYVPPSVSKEEILETIKNLKSQGFSDFNSLMKEIMARFKGRVDGKEVAELIKENL
jgi:uncharacterized protein YqeY